MGEKSRALGGARARYKDSVDNGSGTVLEGVHLCSSGLRFWRSVG